MNKNKIILLIFLIPVFILSNSSIVKKDRFKEYLIRKDWNSVKQLFFDDSYKQLMQKEYSAKIIYLKRIPKIGYKAIIINNEKNIGKLIIIRYSEINGKIGKLKIKEILSKFHVFKGFNSFKINNINFKIADTIVSIKTGYLFVPEKTDSLYIFNGRIKIKVSPIDKEEKAQFKHLFNHSEKTFKMKWLILFSKKITIKNRVKIKKANIDIDRQANKVFKIVFSFKLNNIKNITPFILPNENDNMIIFPLTRGKIMIYTHNKNSIPDTQLYGFNFRKILLDYNYYKTPKFVFQTEQSKIKRINLILNLNGKSIYVKENITLKEKSTNLKLELPDRITIKKIHSSDDYELSLFNNVKNLYINGLEFKNLYLEYIVGIEYKDEFDLNFTSKKGEVFNTYLIDKTIPHLLFLSRDSKYYLKDNLDFFNFHIKVNAVNNRCFSAGEEINTNEFKSESVKGFPLICGDFSLFFKQKNINIFSNTPLKNKVKFDLSKIPDIIDFYTDFFGKLDWNKINIVVSENRTLSALSYKGLIYLKINSRKLTFNYGHSPVKFTNNLIDIVSHEIAHQWWGGLISWKTYRDIWITEGFATFSEILYLKHRYGDSEFKKIIKKMKRSVLKKYKYGPIFYGKRVGNWEEDSNAYFSIIYNKSTLVLLMLKELMGEEKFFNRVKQFLKKYKYRSVSTSLFISFFSKGDKIIKKFLHIWIYNRDMPKIKYHLKIKGRSILIKIKQVNNNIFLFPLRIKIKVKNKIVYKKIIITKKAQDFTIKLSFHPSSAKLDKDWITPLK